MQSEHVDNYGKVCKGPRGTRVKHCATCVVHNILDITEKAAKEALEKARKE